MHIAEHLCRMLPPESYKIHEPTAELPRDAIVREMLSIIREAPGVVDARYTLLSEFRPTTPVATKATCRVQILLHMPDTSLLTTVRIIKALKPLEDYFNTHVYIEEV